VHDRRCTEILNGLPCVLAAGHPLPHRTTWTADPPTTVAPIWGAPLPSPTAPVQPVTPVGASPTGSASARRGITQRTLLVILVLIAFGIVAFAGYAEMIQAPTNDQEVLLDVRRRLLAFPEVEATLSEQGRPEDGTDDEGVNMSETFVRMAPRDKWRRGWTKDRLNEAMRASLTEIPGVSFNFSGPIKDNVEEAVSGVRGQVVLKIFGTDLDQMRHTLEACVQALTKVRGVVDLGLYRDASVPQLQVALDRPALARAGIRVGTAQDVVETALGGRVVTEMWDN
jgi:hypothetical protein